MDLAYACVLIAILFPYVFSVLAKTGRGFNNRRPREYLEKLHGWRKRADWIQKNSFEILPAFSAGIIIAHYLNVPIKTIETLAVAFLISRVLYAVCYLIDQAICRSLFWGVGLGCIIALFFV